MKGSETVRLSAAYAMVFLVLPFTTMEAAAQESTPLGPWLDEVTWVEEANASAAISRIAAGESALGIGQIGSREDIARARSLDGVDTFSVHPWVYEISLNPVERRQPDYARNPFAIREVRRAMQFLVDRDLAAREIFGGLALPQSTLWHPWSPDYGRGIEDLLILESKYSFDPQWGRSEAFVALSAVGWSIGTDGKWHDPEGRLVRIKILRRVQDERFELGAYLASILRWIDFDVELIEVTTAQIPFATDPTEDSWNLYTAAWIEDRAAAWDDAKLAFFAACGGEPYCVPAGRTAPPGYYQPPIELDDIAKTLANRQYGSLEERQRLVARGTELAMQESIRIFVAARTRDFAHSEGFRGAAWDLFSGPVNPWGLKTSRVSPDPNGQRRARILSPTMLVDAWSPYTQPEAIYDAAQRNAMIDPAMARHPHAGRYVGYRAAATVVTAGPDGSLSVPPEALKFNLFTNEWVSVGPGVQAVSAVTFDFTLGRWHHGPPIAMADVLYDIAVDLRNRRGDLECPPGCRKGAEWRPDPYVDFLKGFRVVDPNALTVYVDFWHIDSSEIAGFVARFPRAPWEVVSLAVKLVLEGNASFQKAFATDVGIWLDLTKGPSLRLLEDVFAEYKAADYVPPDLVPFVNASDARSRWAELDTWYGTYEHFWPSNGPFYLASIHEANRTIVMRAFRDYPWAADFWDDLTVIRIPRVTVNSAPSIVLAGTVAPFRFYVTAAGLPADDVTTSWLLRDLATMEFLLRDAAISVGIGLYAVDLSGSVTNNLLLGNFELIFVAKHGEASIPAVVRVAFLILPSSYFYNPPPFPPPDIVDKIDRLAEDIEDTREDLARLARLARDLGGFVALTVLLSIAALGTSVLTLSIHLRFRKSIARPR